MKKRLERERDRVKEGLSAAFTALGVEKVKGMYADISFRASEQTIIRPPHTQTGPISPSGIRSSMIYDRIHGMTSSTSVPPALMQKPTLIRGINGFR